MPSRKRAHQEILKAALPLRSASAARVLAVALLFVAAGCAHHRPTALPPIAETPAPAPPQQIPTEAPSQPVETTPPAGPPATAPATAAPPPAEAKPAAKQPTAKPDVPAKRPVAEPPRAPAPQISPQLSASDQAELIRQTNQFLSDAERNLRSAEDHPLSPNQRDIADKIRGFIKQAREARRTSDWARAKNLSQKAYRLSVELLKTL